WENRDDREKSAVRLLRGFVAPEQGGTAKSPKRLLRFYFSLAPWDALPSEIRDLPPNVDPGLRLRMAFQGAFIEFAMSPQTPRDQLLRGRFDEATTRSVETMDRARQEEARARAEPQLREAVEEWLTAAKTAQAELLRAQSEAARGSAQAQVNLQKAEARVKQLWDRSGRVLLLIQAAGAE